MHWQIEAGCPQCGAPVTLEETDRLLSCPFCRTRLVLVSDGPFRYCLPPAPGGTGELFYLPYWRLRGAAFSIKADELSHRFVDTTMLACRLLGPPASLGFRPQVLKLGFAYAAATGRFLVPDLPLNRAVAEGETPPTPVSHRLFIGDMVSLIHAPFRLRGETLYDAVLDRPVCDCSKDTLASLAQAAPGPPEGVRFLPTLCPHCGRDMEGEKEALVLICRNCDSVWECGSDTFRRLPFAILKPPAEQEEGLCYLPFWRMEPRIEGLPLASYADLICLANLPRVITPADRSAPPYFWSPAFKIHPALYSRWARQMTVFRPAGETAERFPAPSLYPVTLPISEAVEGIVLTLAQLIADKRRYIPALADLRLTLKDFRLEYHPFLCKGHELLHAAMQVAIDPTALAFGIRL